MPEEKVISPIKLSPEQTRRIANAKEDIVRAKHELGVLKKLGMDVGMLEDKLTWADEVQKTLLKEFGV